MTAYGFADLKAGTDLRLAGAEYFQVDLARLGKPIAHRLDRQLRCIAVAAEVAQDNAVDFSWKQFLDDRSCGRVRQMTVARHDPLFYRPRAMKIALQKFFVVIGFDDQGVNLPQPLHNHLRRITEISDEPKPA